MTIDKSFIEKIEQLSAPIFKEFFGLEYSSEKMEVVRPPMASRFDFNSLTAVIDFCENEINHKAKHVIHISDFGTVSLYGPIDEKLRSREYFAKAEAFKHNFSFEQFLGVEKFIISLQASFVQDETTAAILKLVGNMTKVSEVGAKDDGMTQRVEAKVGLAKVENVSVPNPVTLRPYRTFMEIEQPPSRFVLRLNAEHQCALFEADGGAWQLEAMSNINGFISERLQALDLQHNITILC